MEQIFYYRIRIEGFVQGIGFRPFIYNLAQDMGLKGWVNNDTEGVNIELESREAEFELFVKRLKTEKPALADLTKVEVQSEICEKPQFVDFQIHKSEISTAFAADVLPDLATCQACLNDITDVTNRRYQYLFTNCTHCGPRFSIIQALPYDRQNTTMSSFKQCDACQSEYQNPMDRRFHAQPNACPQCGPQVSLHDQEQACLAAGFAALETAVEFLQKGHILALKGIGGYQLVVDAKNSAAIATLRERKRRRRKPLAVMMQTLEEIKSYCEFNALEEKELTSVRAPIVLLKTKAGGHTVSELVAPNNSYLGVFLPNSPLHFWLLKLFGGPLVVTSANLSEEPLVFTEPEVFQRLQGIADHYLIHNRPIARPIDDSVIQVVEDRVFVLRSARGFAPLILHRGSEDCAVAVGPHMKNAFAVALKTKSVLSQHLGDMESDRSQQLFVNEIGNYLQFYHHHPSRIFADAHPSYFTSEWADKIAAERKIPRQSVQHHRAHIYATLAENQVQGSFMGVSWDGTGYGDDGTIWGSEIFLAESSAEPLRRVASLRNFKLLGGEAAVRSPWKVALSLLFEVDMELAHRWYRRHHAEKSLESFQVLHQMWEKNINSPLCTSMGRFLEGVSSLLGILHENEFEADAAIQLEQGALAQTGQTELKPDEMIPWREVNKDYVLDWREWVRAAVTSTLNGDDVSIWAFKIHDRLALSLIELAGQLQQTQMLVGGGVFQNRLLLSRLLQRARLAGLTIYTPSRVPINDGGIAMGQLLGGAVMAAKS